MGIGGQGLKKLDERRGVERRFEKAGTGNIQKTRNMNGEVEAQ